MTLKEYAEILSSLVETDENVANLTFPIDYQDTSIDTIELENTYMNYLSNNQFEEAKQLRKENSVLESRIWDATKANLLQTLMLTAFKFAKNENSAANISYDNSTSGTQASNLQEVADEICDIIGIDENNTGGSLSERIENLEDDVNKKLDETINKLENKTPFPFGIDENGNYGYIKAGADTVTPFKQGFEDSIGLTATAADITKGKTALCNGVIVIGTRPAPVTSESGTFSRSSASLETMKETVYFKTAFDTVPTVTYTLSGSRMEMKNVEVYRTHVIFSIYHSHGTDHHTATVVWTATV